MPNLEENYLLMQKQNTNSLHNHDFIDTHQFVQCLRFIPKYRMWKQIGLGLTSDWLSDDIILYSAFVHIMMLIHSYICIIIILRSWSFNFGQEQENNVSSSLITSVNPHYHWYGSLNTKDRVDTHTTQWSSGQQYDSLFMMLHFSYFAS